jgi:hypothetical protein
MERFVLALRRPHAGKLPAEFSVSESSPINSTLPVVPKTLTREQLQALRVDVTFTHVGIEALIATMEAVLIEGLEPRQNRKRGDDFQAVEFLQVEDPAVQQQMKLAVAKQMLAGVGV